MKQEFDFYTGTASICVFDLEALKHRLNDPADWWSNYFDEVDEVNAGNVIFAALGADGKYSVLLSDEKITNIGDKSVTANLRCSSGRVFVGPGEDVTGGGLEPTTRRTSGRLIDIPKGNYEVLMGLGKINNTHRIALEIHTIAADAKNDFKASIRLR